jgi:hypothetical protein
VWKEFPPQEGREEVNQNHDQGHLSTFYIVSRASIIINLGLDEGDDTL